MNDTIKNEIKCVIKEYLTAQRKKGTPWMLTSVDEWIQFNGDLLKPKTMDISETELNLTVSEILDELSCKDVAMCQGVLKWTDRTVLCERAIKILPYTTGQLEDLLSPIYAIQSDINTVLSDFRKLNIWLRKKNNTEIKEIDTTDGFQYNKTLFSTITIKDCIKLKEADTYPVHLKNISKDDDPITEEKSETMGKNEPVNDIKTFSINWKYKDFEIKSAKGGNDLPYIELVKYNSSRSNYTLAYYRWDREGGELRFVGNRPFKDIAAEDLAPIWSQLWLICELLKDAYEKHDEQKIT